jgi:hypothetical protein
LRDDADVGRWPHADDLLALPTPDERMLVPAPAIADDVDAGRDPAAPA